MFDKNGILLFLLDMLKLFLMNLGTEDRTELGLGV
jgi:hypothetical protein